jgi:anaerobic ribonucleoside-triphosphate reductase activating protein
MTERRAKKWNPVFRSAGATTKESTSSGDADSSPDDVVIGGLTPFSTVDYPGKLAAVVFCRGCALACDYCHNAHLQARAPSESDLKWRDVFGFLTARAGMLDAVVFSGGEALLQRGLSGAVEDAAGLGYEIGLHTAGLSPRALRRIIGRLSWVGFDVKAPFDEYGLVGSQKAGGAARASLDLLLASRAAHEVRMTIHGPKVGRRAVEWAIETLPAMGVKNFALQQARRPGSVFELLDDDGVFSDAGLMAALRAAFEGVVIRRYDLAAAGAARAAA